jgi:hypothetical protein
VECEVEMRGWGGGRGWEAGECGRGVGGDEGWGR